MPSLGERLLAIARGRFCRKVSPVVGIAWRASPVEGRVKTGVAKENSSLLVGGRAGKEEGGERKGREKKGLTLWGQPLCYVAAESAAGIYLISMIASEILIRKSPTCSYSAIKSM